MRLKSLCSFLATFCIYTHLILCKQVSADNNLNMVEEDYAFQQPPIIITSNYMPEDDDTFLYSPIKFTDTGIKCFFTHKYNHPKYVKDVLPNNLADFIQFLEFGKKNNQDRTFTKSVFRLFHQKIKNVEYIQAREFARMLNLLPDLLKEQLVSNSGKTTKKQTKIKDLMYSKFLNEYTKFQEDPDKFLDNLSEDICTSLINREASTEDCPKDELRNMMMRFLECGLSKLLWCPKDCDEVWPNIKDIGNGLYKLKEEGILCDSEDINDLVNTLLPRFAFFIDVAGSDMPPQFYTIAKNDIQQNQISWLELEEQEDFITPKGKVLLQALVEGEIKSRARNICGVIPEDIIPG